LETNGILIAFVSSKGLKSTRVELQAKTSGPSFVYDYDCIWETIEANVKFSMQHALWSLTLAMGLYVL